MVHESTRHSGMAGYLLGELAAIAAMRGVVSFWADVLPENRAMAGLFLAAGGEREKAGGEDGERFRIPVDAILKSRPAFLKSKHIQRIDR